MTRLLLGSAVLATLVQTSGSLACGGLFCGLTPVDQTAERILFEVGEDSTRMTTQISFNGDAADFAWLLPLPVVPDLHGSGHLGFVGPTDLADLVVAPAIEQPLSVERIVPGDAMAASNALAARSTHVTRRAATVVPQCELRDLTETKHMRDAESLSDSARAIWEQPERARAHQLGLQRARRSGNTTSSSAKRDQEGLSRGLSTR